MRRILTVFPFHPPLIRQVGGHRIMGLSVLEKIEETIGIVKPDPPFFFVMDTPKTKHVSYFLTSRLKVLYYF